MKNLLTTLLFCIAASTISAQTFTSIALVNPENPLGASYALPSPVVGALYKYPNAANNIDAYVKITKITNKHVTTTTVSDSVGLFAIDNPAAVNGGYDSAFQPVISSSNVNSNGLWTLGTCGAGNVQISHTADQNYLIHFRVYFKKAGTQNDTALNVHAAFIDIDGFGSGTEAEQDAFMPGDSYTYDSTSVLTFSQTSDGLINVEGTAANINGIDITQNTGIVQVTYLNTTYVDYAFGLNTHGGNLNGVCYSAVSGGRLKSVSFASQPTGLTTITPTDVTISGTLWNDANGSAKSSFTNIKTGNEVGTNGGGLYVYALDTVGSTVIGKATVAGNGTYTITDIRQGTVVKLLLSRSILALGTTGVSTTSLVKPGWAATSPKVTPAFVVGSTNIVSKDFGIDRLPVSQSFTVTLPTQFMNAKKKVTKANGFSVLAGSDAEDGVLGHSNTLVISSITKMKGDKIKYNNHDVQVGDTIVNYDSSLMEMQFKDATVSTPGFQYSFVDNAGFAGIPATYDIVMPSTPLPVKLTSINAEKAGKSAKITWTLAEQLNLATTTVERSSDGRNWSLIAKIANEGSAMKTDFDYTDNSTLAGTNYYRLRFVDNDNSDEYSKVVSVDFSANMTEVSFYPNPVANTLTINNGGNEIAAINIVDQTGNVVKHIDGSQSQIDMTSLTPGIYFLQMYINGATRSYTINKQ